MQLWKERRRRRKKKSFAGDNGAVTVYKHAIFHYFFILKETSLCLRRLWIGQIKTVTKTLYLKSDSCFKPGFAGPGPASAALGRFLLTHSFGAVGRPRGECRKRELIQHIWPSIWSRLSHGGGHLIPQHHEETQAHICILRKGGSQAISNQKMFCLAGLGYSKDNKMCFCYTNSHLMKVPKCLKGLVSND